MAVLPSPDVMYEALARSDPDFDGVFFVGVKTTGVFCRPVCPARKPLPANVVYFAHAKDAIFAGFRPCLRCRPMESPATTPEYVVQALQLVEATPDRRIRDGDLRANGLSPERLRRFFQSSYGMSFQAYARGRRLGRALGMLREGTEVIEAGIEVGFESTSGFREAFARAFGCPPSEADDAQTLPMRWLDTPLGPMVSAADDRDVVLLEFVDRRMLPAQMAALQRRHRRRFHPGTNPVLDRLAAELEEYLFSRRRRFESSPSLAGTPFQVAVWEELGKIPYGETLSYAELARRVGRPDAQRAVGKANGDNRIAILVPCHRVVRSDGSLCGYGGGLWRKRRLLELEAGQTSFPG